MKDIRIEDEIAAKLALFATRRNETIDGAAALALREFFSQLDEEERLWHEALAADADIERNGGVEGEKVMSWLRQWGRDGEPSSPEA